MDTDLILNRNPGELRNQLFAYSARLDECDPFMSAALAQLGTAVETYDHTVIPLELCQVVLAAARDRVGRPVPHVIHVIAS